MDDRERLLELLGSMRRDMVPGLMQLHEDDDLRLLHSAMLHVLDRGGHPTVKELAAAVGRSESRTSRVVDQLVRRGLVERYEDPGDRRARRLRISDEGTALLLRIREVRNNAQMELWDYLTEEEQQVAMHAMELFAKAARRYRDDHH
ncbi:DNA-binding MarR family transcriptional regulator [Murinocardiopsis flavida]|uniref:DNA-binding MarR family transcriptional regulator n=1 Tax=Murinocardiopsis flavida TaxID=645275 RepID=A0A2P8DMJ7_9ACTN|nr:MarR family transcriptional regulator [Murinocardiopsis flavida]PSK98427.1 DNA-binding MarR family transcriptional regulator [Murinocardiopsis flavida]